ncbi:unnamed protein product [[Candida] boidinii]|nr:unnamed protein product [[Candida] boidinii]
MASEPRKYVAVPLPRAGSPDINSRVYTFPQPPPYYPRQPSISLIPPQGPISYNSTPSPHLHLVPNQPVYQIPSQSMQQVPVEDGENVHLPPYGVTHSHHSHYYAHQEDVGTFESHQEIEGVSDDSKKQRRTKRACDLCNRKRTKCDGAFPTCNKCSRSNSACSYLRQKKRRGRASEKYPKIIIRRKPTKRQRVSDNLNIIPCGNNNSNYESANSVSPSSVSMDLNPSCDADPASTMNLSGFIIHHH